MSDTHTLITDSSGIVDDMIIQSVSADLHLVTTDDRKIHCWAGETVIEEDLIIKGDLIMDFNKAGFTISNELVATKIFVDNSFASINILSNNNDASFNNVDISGSLKVNDISVATLNTTSLSNYTLSGQLYTQSQLHSCTLDLSFNNVDISGTLKVNDISVATLNTSSLSNYTLTSELYSQSQLHSGNLDLSFNNVDISGNLNVSGINVYQKILQLDNSINTIDLQQWFDASLGNVDISGNLNVSGINVYQKFSQLDNSINTIDLKQWFDASLGNVDISGNLNVSGILNISGINVYQKFLQLDNSINTIDLQQWFDASLGNVDISGNLNVSGINVYQKFSQLDNSINTIDLKQWFDASLGNVDISGILDVSLINVLTITNDSSNINFDRNILMKNSRIIFEESNDYLNPNNNDIISMIDDLSVNVNSKIDDLSVNVNSKIDDLSVNVNSKIDDLSVNILSSYNDSLLGNTIINGTLNVTGLIRGAPGTICRIHIREYTNTFATTINSYSPIQIGQDITFPKVANTNIFVESYISTEGTSGSGYDQIRIYYNFIYNSINTTSTNYIIGRTCFGGASGYFSNISSVDTGNNNAILKLYAERYNSNDIIIFTNPITFKITEIWS